MDLKALRKLEQRADAATEAGDIQLAADLSRQILAALPAGVQEEDAHSLRLKTLKEFGQQQHMLNDGAGALVTYQQYIDEAPSPAHKVAGLVGLANQHTYMGNYTAALPVAQAAHQLAEENDDLRGRAMALGAMGLVYNAWGRFDEALARLHESLRLHEEVQDWLEQARTHNRIGVVNSMTGKVDKAIAAFQRSVRLASHSAGSVALLTRLYSLNNLGECYQFLNDMEQALTYHREAVDIAESIDPHLADDMYRNIGTALLALGRREEALDYLQRALAINEETTDTNIRVQVLDSLAQAELSVGNLEAGHQYALQLQTVADESDALFAQADANYVLGLYYSKIGDKTAAEELWQQALFMSHETGQRELLWRTHAGLAEISDNPTLATVHYRIARDVIMQTAEPIEDIALREKYLSGPTVQAVLARVEP